MTYDAWKTRSDLDELVSVIEGPPETCDICGGPLGDNPWAEWSSDGENVLFCDQCASDRDEEPEPMGEPSPTANRETPK